MKSLFSFFAVLGFLTCSVQSEAASLNNFSVSGVMALSADTDKSPDLAGAMLGLGSSVKGGDMMLNVGYLYGSESASITGDGLFARYDTDVTSIPIQISYTYAIPLGRSLSLFIGGIAGYSFNNYELSGNVQFDGEGGSGSMKEDSFDPMIGAVGGLKYQLGAKTSIFVSYEYWQVWMKQPFAGKMGYASGDLDPKFNVIKAGLTFRF